jgi:acetyl-CoA carboxylase carboxyl transferase subunit alpha
MSDKRILELERKIRELKAFSDESIDLSAEIEKLEAKLEALKALPPPPTNLADDWEQVKLARHPKRPYTLDYLRLMMDDFYELHGDQMFADDAAIVAGVALFEGETVVVVGHQKGRDVAENIKRNFGMAHPEGYRKALRALKFAERFGFPVISLIDTPAAYPGTEAEERNIGGSIAQNIYEMFKLRVPIIVAVIGEGGSGGALGLGVGDRVLMLQHAIYSVIPPEGCAAILFRDAKKAPEAARAMKVTAPTLQGLRIIDEVIPEPNEGAHTDHESIALTLKEAIRRHLKELSRISTEKLLEQRSKKFQAMGVFEELEETHARE